MTTTRTTTKAEYLLEYQGKDGSWTPSGKNPHANIAEATRRGEEIGFGFGEFGMARIRLREIVVTTSVSEEIILVGDMGTGSRARARRVKEWRKPEGSDV
jgi:hypothetical protein